VCAALAAACRRAPSPADGSDGGPDIVADGSDDDSVRFSVPHWLLAYLMCAAALLLLPPLRAGDAGDALPSRVYELPCAAFATTAFSSVLSLFFNHGTPQGRQAALTAYVATVMALTNAAYLAAPAHVLRLPWGATLLPLRVLSWLFTIPGLFAEMSAVCRQPHAEWARAVALNAAMLGVGTLGLLAGHTSWLLAAALLAGGCALFERLLRTVMRAWFDAALACTLPGSEEHRKTRLLYALTVATWFLFPAVQLLGMCSSPPAVIEVMWALCDVCSKFVWCVPAWPRMHSSCSRACVCSMR
jgi:hypothetical protein